MVRLWAEKEMRNLKRLRAAGIDCPDPVEVRENVLVMTFVGNEGWASPRLKDAGLTTEQLTPLYLSLVSTVRTMFHTCHLVHADLSEYNILYHNGALWIIDVSQSVEHDHPSAFDFLRSDLSNVEEFFGRGGVATLGIRKTFEFVTKEKLSENPEESDEEVLKRWLEEKAARGAEEEEEEEAERNENIDESGRPPSGSAMKQEDDAHEDSVFMKSFIPRNLNEVYDPERDVEKVARGEGKNLIYADTIGVVSPETTSQAQEDRPTESQEAVDVADESGGDGEDSDEDDEQEEDEKDGFVERKPRGHRHEDKEAKKERKKAVKEQARERRKNKMPKAEKKKLVKRSKA